MALIQALHDSVPDVRVAAAQAVGHLGVSAAMRDGLIAALRHGDAPTRRVAIQALGLLEERAAFYALEAALDDPDAGVRQGAVAALGELADRRALPALAARLVRDTDAGVRSEAAFRLGKLGDASVLSTLHAAERDPDAGVRRWAARAVLELEGAEG